MGYFKDLFSTGIPCPKELTKEENNKRFQNQRFIKKLWLSKALALVPLKAIHLYLRSTESYYSHGNYSFRLYLSIARGMTESDMRYYWTTSEVFDKLLRD